ncbi:MAG TPA: methyltransferase [Candidatus Methanoperedens sp.]
MESLILFKTVQFIILVILIVYISDFRKKKGMHALMNEKLILALKLCYLIPICIYGYVLITLDRLLFSDFVAIIFTFFGTLLAARAKIDLGKNYTWTGYHFEAPKHVTKGVYAFIRHPLYTGLYISAFGFLSTIIPHAPRLLTAVVLITLAYIMVFLALAAAREDKFLSQEFGEEFLKYQEQVHPFLPLRKFKDESIIQ